MVDWLLIGILCALFLGSLTINFWLWKKVSLFSTQLRQVEELIEQRDMELNKLRKNLSTRSLLPPGADVKMPEPRHHTSYQPPNAAAATREGPSNKERMPKSGMKLAAEPPPSPEPKFKPVPLPEPSPALETTVPDELKPEPGPEPVLASWMAAAAEAEKPAAESKLTDEDKKVLEDYLQSRPEEPATESGENEEEVMDVVHEDSGPSPHPVNPEEEISLFDVLSQAITLTPLEEMLLLAPEQRPRRVLLDFGKVMFLFDDQHEALERLLQKASSQGIQLTATGVASDLRNELKSRHADLIIN
jgi:hypothetical protein